MLGNVNIFPLANEWGGGGSFTSRVRVKDVSATSDIWIQSQGHLKSFSSDITNHSSLYVPDLVTWSVCSTQANPVEFDHEKHPYRRRRAEKRCALDCGGTSARMSRSSERTTPPRKNRRCGTSRLEVKATAATTGSHPKRGIVTVRNRSKQTGKKNEDNALG